MIAGQSEGVTDLEVGHVDSTRFDRPCAHLCALRCRIVDNDQERCWRPGIGLVSPAYPYKQFQPVVWGICFVSAIIVIAKERVTASQLHTT